MLALWWTLTQWYVIGWVLVRCYRRARHGRWTKPVLAPSTPVSGNRETGPKWEQDVPYALSVDYEEDDL